MDYIVTHPDHVDFPLWREWMRQYRDYFSKVIVVWMKSNQGVSVKDFVMDAMREDKITFIESPSIGVGQDWRDVAVNHALNYSVGEWVCFAEQDILITGDKIWSQVSTGFNSHDVVGWKDGDTRLHPAFLWVKRTIIDKTRRDFSIEPNVSDHFSKFYTDLLNIEAKIKLVPQLEASHFAGLTHNMTLARDGVKVHHRPDPFKTYLKKCLSASVPLHDEFVTVATNYLKEN
jgi:hypothetical protein